MTDFLVLATVWNLGMPLRGTPLELEIREFSHGHKRFFRIIISEYFVESCIISIFTWKIESFCCETTPLYFELNFSVSSAKISTNSYISWFLLLITLEAFFNVNVHGQSLPCGNGSKVNTV